MPVAVLQTGEHACAVRQFEMIDRIGSVIDDVVDLAWMRRIRGQRNALRTDGERQLFTIGNRSFAQEFERSDLGDIRLAGLVAALR